MAFIPNSESHKVGDRVRLGKNFSTLQGTMLKGTMVTIIEIEDRGYSFRDDEGHVIREAGWQLRS